MSLQQKFQNLGHALTEVATELASEAKGMLPVVQSALHQVKGVAHKATDTVFKLFKAPETMHAEPTEALADPLAQALKINAVLEARIAELEKAAQSKAVPLEAGEEQTATLPLLSTPAHESKIANALELPAPQTTVASADSWHSTSADSPPESLDALLIGSTPDVAVCG